MKDSNSTISNIDPFILFFSPLIAPIAIISFTFISSWQLDNLASIAFWQIAIAFTYSGFYLAISLPINWLIWRFYWQSIVKLPSPIIWAFFITFLFMFILSRNTEIVSPTRYNPEIISAILGLTLNAIGFLLLQRRTSTDLHPLNKN